MAMKKDTALHRNGEIRAQINDSCRWPNCCRIYRLFLKNGIFHALSALYSDGFMKWVHKQNADHSIQHVLINNSPLTL